MAGHLILAANEAPHCPTSETRRQVAAMVACGLDHVQVAFVLKCTPDEIRYHYSDELKHGIAITNAEVGAALLRNCLRGDTNAQKFWLATRAGWAPPTPEEQKKNQGNQRLTQEKRDLMDEILTMVAKDKEKVEAAETTARANRTGVQ